MNQAGLWPHKHALKETRVPLNGVSEERRKQLCGREQWAPCRSALLDFLLSVQFLLHNTVNRATSPETVMNSKSFFRLGGC